MARKKLDPNILVEINRRAFNASGFLPFFDFRLEMIWREYQSIGDRGSHIWSLLPVPMITHLEVFFRTAIRILIDYGDPYLDRAESLARNFGIGFPTMKALHGQNITIGMLISHSLPFSEYSHFDSPISCLLDAKLGNLLETIYDRWAVEIEKKEKQPIIEDLDEVIGSVEKVFQARHIVVHEVTDAPPFDQSEVDIFYQSIRKLMKATHEILKSIDVSESTPHTN